MKKIVIGITAPSSVVLLEGQMEYFANKGYDVFLLGPIDSRVVDFCKRENCILLPVDVEREISLWKDLKALKKVYTHLRRIKPDIVNLGTPKIALLGMIASWLLGIKKRIYTCRGFRFEHEKGFKKKLLLTTEKLTSLLAHKIICISNSVKDLGVDMGIFRANKCIVINKGSSNGISLKRFKRENISSDEIEHLKKKLFLNDDFVFGFVGRLVDRKGINELFKAFSLIYDKDQSFRLLVVGPIEDNQIADKGLVGEMQQHPGVILAGVQKDVPLFLSVMNVFLLPAWWEGFGNVLIQAAAMGVPVIGTNATGVKDAVCQNYNGLLVDPESVEQLVESMLLLYHNKELREKFGRNGPEWAKNFDNQIIWKGMEQIYNATN